MIIELSGKRPQIGENAWIADNAAVAGDVKIGKEASVWFSASIRGDAGSITIGDYTNIQDNSVLHVTPEDPLEIGDYTTIGHNVILHGCKIGRNVVIGMGAIILNGAVIGDNSIVGAGTLVTEGKEFPPNSLIFGSPAKLVRELDQAAIDSNMANTLDYVKKAQRYKNESKRID